MIHILTYFEVSVDFLALRSLFDTQTIQIYFIVPNTKFTSYEGSIYVQNVWRLTTIHVGY